MKTQLMPVREKRLTVLDYDRMRVEEHIREGKFQRSLSLMTAISGLFTGLEVSYEHYRGSYGRRVMYTPVILSLFLGIAGVWGALSRKAARFVLPITSVAVMLDGVIGFYYHVRGIHRKPGGWRIFVVNLVMGPPVFAPLLFAVIGSLGLLASLLQREDAPRYQPPVSRWQVQSVIKNWLPPKIARTETMLKRDVRTGRFQRLLAIVTAITTFLVSAEALYSHYKNNFAFRVQWTPIILGPLLIMSSLAAFWSRAVARMILPVASLLVMLNGSIGFFYHVRGVIRRPGGLRKPIYNVIYGPPVFAPLLFTASGSIGLLTSLLRRTGE